MLRRTVLKHLLFPGAAPPLLELVLAGCAASSARIMRSDANETMVTGTVAYPERMAFAPDAVVEVRLSDVSRQDVAALVIAETTVLPEGR